MFELRLSMREGLPLDWPLSACGEERVRRVHPFAERRNRAVARAATWRIIAADRRGPICIESTEHPELESSGCPKPARIRIVRLLSEALGELIAMIAKHDRRSGYDRREEDEQSYSGKEKRRRVEPRIPEVIEATISEIEWLTYFSPKEKDPVADITDSGPEILGNSKH